MWLNIQDELLIDRYLSDPYEFTSLVQQCRDMVPGTCKGGRADDAIHLLESLFRLAQARREELALH